MLPGIRVARSVEEPGLRFGICVKRLADGRQELIEEDVGGRNHVINVNLALSVRALGRKCTTHKLHVGFAIADVGRVAERFGIRGVQSDKDTGRCDTFFGRAVDTAGTEDPNVEAVLEGFQCAAGVSWSSGPTRQDVQNVTGAIKHLIMHAREVFRARVL